MAATSGSIRFNTDSSKLEIYNGEAWFEIDATSPEEQTGGTRGIVFGEQSNTSDIEFYNVDTTGDAVDFADMTRSSTVSAAAFASRVRGIASGGGSPSPTNIIEFITFAIQNNAQDFGDLHSATNTGKNGSVSSATRGIFSGFYPAQTARMDFVTIMSAGNAQDFGDMTATWYYHGGCSDSNGGIGE